MRYFLLIFLVTLSLNSYALQCFYTDSKDRLVRDFVPIDQCDSYVVFTVSEFESINLLLNGGFSLEAFGIGFGGIITLWIIGLTSGIIISQIRKANR